MPPPPRYIAFGSGGLHGLAFVGALLALEGQVDLREVEGCIGTSIGALFALALCLGLTSERLAMIVLERADWSRISTGINVHSVVERYGLETRAGLEYLVQLVLTEAGLTPSVTLHAVHPLTKRHFCCCVTDLTHMRLRYLDHETAPDLSVCDAVVASMCIPVLFEPSVVDGAMCVDGGIMESVPVRFFALEHTLVVRFVVERVAESIANWRDYVSAILRAAQLAKEDLDESMLADRPPQQLITLEVPKHLPTSLELHRVTPRIVHSLLTVGFLQSSPLTASMEAGVGAVAMYAIDALLLLHASDA